MSSQPGVYCDSEPGSGKRIKTQLTGRNAFDMRFAVTASDEYAAVDYFTFGKTSNFTGARMTGFTVELLDANGDPMSLADVPESVLFNLDATDIGIGARLPDGLFGAGGNEGEIGFFSDGRAGISSTLSSDVLAFGALTNADYVALFGDAFLDDSMTPDGLFWDDNADPEDESALVAWNNIGGGGWTYGALATAANIDGRLAELAAALGVEVADLGYVDGGLVPEEILALAEASGLFGVDAIEDIRNANLNFTMTIGNPEDGEFVLRISPEFAPIVAATSSELGFRLAGLLDGVANVPYLDIGNAAAYRDAIADIMEMSEEDAERAILSTGHSFLPAYTNIQYEFSRNHIEALTNTIPWEVSESGSVMRQGNTATWHMTDGLLGVFAVGGSSSSYDSNISSVGYKVKATAVSAGLEKLVSPTTSIGFALGGSSGSADATGGLGSIDADGYSLTGFVRTHIGEAGLLQALLGYQDLSYDTERDVPTGTARGKTDGSQVYAALKYDHLTRRGAFTFGPTASVEYYDMSVDGFTETGGGIWNTTVSDQSSNIFVGSIGMRGEYDLSGSGNNKLTGSLAYTKASGSDFVVDSGFVGLPGTSFPVAGRDDDWVDVKLGFETVSYRANGGQTLFHIGYGGSFGSSYESHRLQAGLDFEF